MKTKLILLGLALLLSAACLLVSTPLPAEELVEKYSTTELALGFLAVAAMIASPLFAPVLLFPRLFE